MQTDFIFNKAKISYFQFRNKYYLVNINIYLLDSKTGQWHKLDEKSEIQLKKDVFQYEKAISKKTLGPAWLRNEIEKPLGERDMGGWISHIYTEEQQKRLGVNELGEKI
jgi:hypothetical protein